MDEPQDNAAPEQGTAQPEATGTAPAKSAAETKLETQLTAATAKGEGYKKELDKARQALTASNKERDTARTDLVTALGTITSQNEEIERLKREKTDAIESADKQPADTTQEPGEEEFIKDLLKRNGLKIAYMLVTGPCFSEAHAREYAGAEFDSLPTISLD